MQALLELKREIEQNFSLSVANKVYTFPRKISCFEDVFSSDEEEIENPENRCRPYLGQ